MLKGFFLFQFRRGFSILQKFDTQSPSETEWSITDEKLQTDYPAGLDSL